MAKVCKLTGVRPMTGNNVSHSNKKTKRRFLPNLQKKKFYLPEEGRTVTIKVSTRAMRTIDKMGISAYIRKMRKKGIDITV